MNMKTKSFQAIAFYLGVSLVYLGLGMINIPLALTVTGAILLGMFVYSLVSNH